MSQKRTVKGLPKEVTQCQEFSNIERKSIGCPGNGVNFANTYIGCEWLMTQWGFIKLETERKSCYSHKDDKYFHWILNKYSHYTTYSFGTSCCSMR